MDIEKYRAIAQRFNVTDILMVSPEQVVFDIRAVLKCRWGCDNAKHKTIRCETNGLSIEERRQMIMAYRHIFLLHNNDAHDLTLACLELEKALFLDGYYFAFALRACNFCKDCNAKKGKECSHPGKVRPCEEMFGIDVYQTVKNAGLPINVLHDRDETQNRYGFVLVE